MDPAFFDQLERTFRLEGPDAAIHRLCADLRQRQDYAALFYALLMKTRHQLGVSPIPTGSAQDLPKSVLPDYEEGIRQAAREVGGLFLQAGDLPQAWPYFRMIGEPEAMRAALETHQPPEGEDVQGLVQIAFYEGVHPMKGFDWILGRYGLCSAITTLGSQELPHPEEVRQYCIRALVRALYAELRDRLAGAIEHQEGQAPPEAQASAGTPGVVQRLMAGRDWLFQDDFYHVDISHLSSVAQMSLHLAPSPELHLARELCVYGQRLSGRFIGPGDPPFEDQYRAYGTYLSILAGEEVDKGLDYFRYQADKADPEEVGTYPAEVLVNLLLKLGRTSEALAVARQYLAGTDSRRLTCPGITELCQKVRDYQTLAEAARVQGDPVHFLAGLLAGGRE
jgi:hypothetical protein